jgi:hypothetical protein
VGSGDYLLSTFAVAMIESRAARNRIMDKTGDKSMKFRSCLGVNPGEIDGSGDLFCSGGGLSTLSRQESEITSHLDDRRTWIRRVGINFGDRAQRPIYPRDFDFAHKITWENAA